MQSFGKGFSPPQKSQCLTERKVGALFPKTKENSMSRFTRYRDLYQTILIDTPIGKYFEEFLNSLQCGEGELIVDESGEPRKDPVYGST